jgi:hypothetical protein
VNKTSGRGVAPRVMHLENAGHGDGVVRESDRHRHLSWDLNPVLPHQTTCTQRCQGALESKCRGRIC